jgi:hypothetical protein
LHGQADDVVAFGAQHGRDGGGVHTARHRYGNRICTQLVRTVRQVLLGPGALGNHAPRNPYTGQALTKWQVLSANDLLVVLRRDRAQACDRLRY